MKAVVAAFNQEKALVGAFSVITNLRMELFEALTLKWVSEPRGTLCMYDSLMTSTCTGARHSVSLDWMAAATGPGAELELDILAEFWTIW